MRGLTLALLAIDTPGAAGRGRARAFIKITAKTTTKTV
jgi:hypothetical protein